MLVATVNPPAKKVIQQNPFTTTEYTGDKMIIKCDRYIIGASPTTNDDARFDIRFGNIKYETNPDGSQGSPIFNILVTYSCSLTQEELATWGTDDTVIFNIVAQKVGFQVVSLVDIPGLYFTN